MLLLGMGSSEGFAALDFEVRMAQMRLRQQEAWLQHRKLAREAVLTSLAGLTGVAQRQPLEVFLDALTDYLDTRGSR
jgi:hypothetical protein